VEVAPRSVLEIPLDPLFEGFRDTTYAYRFGPPGHDIVAVTLTSASGEALARATHYPLGRGAILDIDPELDASATILSEDVVRLDVRARRFAHAVFVDAQAFVAEDQSFDIHPGETRSISLRRHREGALRGSVRALNSSVPVTIRTLT
jgi:beta-mannosidase